MTDKQTVHLMFPNAYHLLTEDNAGEISFIVQEPLVNVMIWVGNDEADAWESAARFVERKKEEAV